MKSLTLTEMRTLEAGYVRGDVCGAMVGAMTGSLFLWGPFAASIFFIFTPVTCLLEYGMQL